MKEIKTKGDLIVRKSDVIVKARYRLNPLALKFITTLIANVSPGDDLNEVYRLKIKDFGELAKLKRKDLYWAVKEALKELLEKPIYIPKGDENDNSFLMLNWAASVEYKEGEGVVEFEISNKLRPYILEARKRFLKYRLENILKLRSSYTIRLYEMLKDWLSDKNNIEKVISVDELRIMLNVPKSYPYGGTSGIKKRILEKAKIEFFKHTDILLEYEEIKTGRKVTHLRIKVVKNLSNENYSEEILNVLGSVKSFREFLKENYSDKFFGFTNRDGKIFYLKMQDGKVVGISKDYVVKEFDKEESLKIYKNWLTLAKNYDEFKSLYFSKINFWDLDERNINILIQKILDAQAKELIIK
jgi:plasmid replication initiation protein